MSRLFWFLICGSLLFASNSAQAAFIVTIPNATVNAGQDAYLDVTIHSDDPGDLLTGFVMSYQIDAPGLSFFTVAPGVPDEAFLTDSSLTPSYVFLGNSLEANGPPVGTVSPTNDTYTLDDGTADFSAQSLGSTEFLLARLHLVAATAGNYTISINLDNSRIFDENTDPQSFVVEGSGEVQVDEVSAVPEPSGFVLCGIGALAFITRLRRKRTS